MNVGVTGPSRLTAVQLSVVEREARQLPEPQPGDLVVSGAATGADSVFATTAFELGWPVMLVVPAGRHNTELVEYGRRRGWRIERMPHGTTHLQRDDRVVELIERLYAFVWVARFYRSGEWATVNRARRRGREIHGLSLRDGQAWTEPRREGC